MNRPRIDGPGVDRTAENLLVLSKRIRELKQALAAEQAARAAAERERDEYREGFHAIDEMYKAAVAIFKEQRRVLGVPENDGVSITDHCAKLMKRLWVAMGALEDIAAMRTWAGVWHPNCECGKRLPQIFDKADAALAALDARRGGGREVGEGTDSPTGLTAQGV